MSDRLKPGQQHPEMSLPIDTTNPSMDWYLARKADFIPQRVSARDFNRSYLTHDPAIPYDEWGGMKRSVRMVQAAASIDIAEYLLTMPLEKHLPPLQDSANVTLEEINIAISRSLGDLGKAVEKVIWHPTDLSLSSRFAKARDMTLNSNTPADQEEVRDCMGFRIKQQATTPESRLPGFFATLLNEWKLKWETEYPESTRRPQSKQNDSHMTSEDLMLLVAGSFGILDFGGSKNALWIKAADSLVTEGPDVPFRQGLFKLKDHNLVFQDEERFFEALRRRYELFAKSSDLAQYAVQGSGCPMMARDLQGRKGSHINDHLVKVMALRVAEYIQGAASRARQSQ